MKLTLSANDVENLAKFLDGKPRFARMKRELDREVGRLKARPSRLTSDELVAVIGVTSQAARTWPLANAAKAELERATVKLERMLTYYERVAGDEEEGPAAADPG